MAMEKTVDDDSNNGESYGRRHRGWRKLQMCPSMVKEAVDSSLGSGVSYIRKPQRGRELCTRATTIGSSDLSIDDRGSIRLVRWRRRELRTEAATTEQRCIEGRLWRGFYYACMGHAGTGGLFIVLSWFN